MTMKPTRDQARAAHAYAVVERIENDESALKNFKIVVNGFGTTVLRGGLCAAIAWVQRYPDKQASKRLLGGLANAGIAGVGTVQQAEFPGKVRRLAPADYMLATRDAIAAVIWLRRAVQAAG